MAQALPNNRRGCDHQQNGCRYGRDGTQRMPETSLEACASWPLHRFREMRSLPGRLPQDVVSQLEVGVRSSRHLEPRPFGEPVGMDLLGVGEDTTTRGTRLQMGLQVLPFCRGDFTRSSEDAELLKLFVS